MLYVVVGNIPPLNIILVQLIISRQEFTNPRTGKYFQAGDTIKRVKYADTLRKIGQTGSADIFYSGEMGEDIVKEIQALDGIITKEDLKSFK